ncbi:MAG: ssDNA-binding domain-containing protein [Hyphomonadaceae bacterium]|jgi:antirestriction protein ArdC|nr:ssDNA-binding domain-containing protein [Hyphomonadaceae bacterium]
MRSQAQKPRSDIYQTITSKLLAAIEASPGDPIMPWQRGGTQPVLPTNAVTGQAYRGVNILSLWVSALERGYESGEWATLRQWNEKGARVRKGEKASPIVFYKEITVASETDGDDGEAETERRRFARGYWVFAAEQVDGYQPAAALPHNPITRIAAAEAYFAATGAKVVVGGTQACYRASTDTIHMPDEARFLDTDGRTRTEAWYAVLGHESTHWAGAPRRLNREFGKRFGDDAYCFEEACAEIGAAFLCARLGIAIEPHPDHARYIQHWLTVMKADPRAIFAAAAKAQEAVAYLDGLQSTPAQSFAA